MDRTVAEIFKTNDKNEHNSFGNFNFKETITFLNNFDWDSEIREYQQYLVKTGSRVPPFLFIKPNDGADSSRYICYEKKSKSENRIFVAYIKRYGLRGLFKFNKKCIFELFNVNKETINCVIKDIFENNVKSLDQYKPK